MNTRTPLNRFRPVRTGLVLAAGLGLAACVTVPYEGTSRVPPPPAEPPQRVFFYPLNDQTAEQQDRDRYECFNWAVKETGFDPSRRGLQREQRQAVVPAPSGAAAFAGAITGAVLGAAVSGPGNSGKGAVVGAVAGGMLGAAAENQATAEAERINAAQARRGNGRYTNEMSDYRRAMSACLEGRGYSVK
jgi:hypothetical protein